MLYLRTVGFAKFVKPPYFAYGDPSGGLDHLALSAGAPRGARVNRVPEADDTTDDAETHRVELSCCALEVVDAELRAHASCERHAGLPTDLARLVLQVELDCVDLLRAHELEDAAAQLVVRPAVRGDVDGPNRLRR
jgi:hypothetical protein